MRRMQSPPQAHRRHASMRSLVLLLVLCVVVLPFTAMGAEDRSRILTRNRERIWTGRDRKLAPKKGSTYYSYDYDASSTYYYKASKKKSKKSKIGYYAYEYEHAVATVEDEEDEDEELRLEFSYDELQDSEEDADVSVDTDKDSILTSAAYYTSKKKSKKSSKNNYYSYYYYSSKKKEEKKSEKNSSHKSEKNSAHKSEKKSHPKSATKSEQSSNKSPKSEKKSDPVPNKRPTRKPTSASTNDPATCAANPVCQGLGLTGDCCPNGSVLLDCCAQCVAAPACAAQGLQDGDCCPTEDGVYLDCCTNTPSFNQDDKVFVPEERWTRTVDDALPDDTGFLFYDPVTKYAWYAYNAARHPTNVESMVVGTNVALGRSSVLTTKTQRVATIGRICPLDTTRKGKILDALCLKIVPETAPYSAAAPTAISSTIQAVEACYGSVKKGAPLVKLAVIVRDDASNQQDTPYGALVGSRLLVYDMILAGSDNQNDKNQPISALEMEVEYEGWASVYGAPLLHGRPTFSSNCHTVYTTWLTKPLQASQPQTTTIATNILQGGMQNSGELWRWGTGSRIVGLAISSSDNEDEEVLFGATNVHNPETTRTLVVVQLNATTGQVLDDYNFAEADDEDGRAHNAFTNVVVDPNMQTLYYIDSGYGLVQFKGTQLSAGPRWTALQSTNQQKKTPTLEILSSRKRSGSSSSSNPPLHQKEERVLRPKQDHKLNYNELFTAYQPAVDPATSMVYGCSGNAYNSHLGLGEDQGIVAVDTQSGRTVWYTPTPPTVVYTAVVGSPKNNEGTTKVVPNLGACGGITADLQLGSSWAAVAGASSATEHPKDGHTGLYLARYSRIECLDSTDGTLLWTYNAAASTKDTDRNTLSKFVVISGDTVLVANGGTVVSLQTTKEPVVTPIVAPTAVPAAPTTKPQPTTKPNYSPGAVPTSPPTESDASPHTVVRSAAILSALALSLVLML